MLKFKPLIKYSIAAGVGLGIFSSLHANNYDVTSIGIVRFANAAVTVFDIGLYYKRHLYNSNVQSMDHDSEEYLQLKSSVHQRGADSLLHLCCLNRGVFIKVGQHIGALDYLLPSEYVSTMKVLHSRAPSSTLKEVYTVLRQDLGREPDEVFSAIEAEPLGTASLAQVHRATLKDGRTVAVKVQHATVRSNSLVDMKTMEFLVSIVSMVFPDFQFEWLVRETKRNIPLELDFHNEGKNAEKVQKLLSEFSWLQVPSVHWDLTTHRVLTMEFVEGGQVNDVGYIKSAKIDPVLLSTRLGDMYSEMIFRHGFVHADPHPGNILVQSTTDNKDFKVILLDHGLYAELEPRFRRQYAQLWLSILDSDTAAMKRIASQLGVGELYWLFSCMVTGRTWEAITGGLTRNRPNKSEKNVFQQEIPKFLPQISSVLAHVDRQMLLLFKTNDLLRGIEHTLQTHGRRAALLAMASRCVRTEYAERRRETLGSLARGVVRLCEAWASFKIRTWYWFLRFQDYFGFA